MFKNRLFRMPAIRYPDHNKAQPVPLAVSRTIEPLNENREGPVIPHSESRVTTTSSRLIEGAVYFALLAISVAIFEPLISKLSAIGGDYVAHLKWASEIEEHGKLILPHPLYHVLVIVAKKLLAIDYIAASTVVILLAISLLAILSYRVLAPRTSLPVAFVFSVCLLLVTPLQAFFFVDNHLYFGYIGITVYHSPTMLLLKPLSLIVFCYALKTVDRPAGDPLPSALAFAAAIFVCGISKPNFLLIVLPAFVLFLMITQQLHSTLKRPYIYGAFFLPVLLVLSLQFFHTYFYQGLSTGTGNEESHVLFLPFETFSHYSNFLTGKLFLSIAFPLLVLLSYPKASTQNKAFVLAFLCLLMGMILTYFFAESGYRMYAGNFWWSGQIGLYLAFLFSLAFLLGDRKSLTRTVFDKIKYGLCLSVFFAHTACGVFYYRQELLFGYMQYW
ncbi:hypothetical protein PUR31_10315 [Pseudomonas mosselii]|uniref:hypothetical protein n=1 Tax=unclassified Pseudomonas TaxID=196821 RepID=UPI0020C56504|nr:MULTISPECIES: hypothetical protein [unclassified Pseudomonas]MCP8632737.1 hypothetical protein [Pseudomonas sp. DVZ6]MDD7784481.1 hypothetical protein [Pseudomonas sp. DVZ24]